MIRSILTICVLCLSAAAYSQTEGLESNEKGSYENQEVTQEDNETIPQSFTLDPMDNGDTKPDGETDPITQGMGHQPMPEDNDFGDDQNLTSENQKQDGSDDEIQTLSRGKYHNGFFGAFSVKATEFNEENIVMTGFRFGWIANRAIAIGFEGYGVIPTAEYPEIDPYFNSRVVGGYGGMFLEPILFSNKLLHVTFPVSGGAGWLGYIYDWEEDYHYGDDLIDGDVFWYIEPGAGLEINVSKAFRIHTGASYRITQDLNIIQTDNKAFNGWNYFLTFKFGRF